MMSDSNANQSFNVDDIRRIRNEDAERYQRLNMTPEEISRDIHERAQIGYQIIEGIRLEKAQRQSV
jgi:hypothetical protein